MRSPFLCWTYCIIIDFAYPYLALFIIFWHEFSLTDHCVLASRAYVKVNTEIPNSSVILHEKHLK